MKTHARSVSRFLGMLAVLGWQTASAVEVSWTKQPGSALYIASNAGSASLWTVGTDQGRIGSYTGNIVYKWNGTDFVKQNDFVTTRIGVTTTDQVWRVHPNGLQVPNGMIMDHQPLDIAVGVDNTVWIIDGKDPKPGGYGIYQIYPFGNLYDSTYANAGAMRIAVDKAGIPWVVKDAGDVYMYDKASKSWGKKGTKKARSVHTGASSGSVWMLGVDAIPGGFPIYRWNTTTLDWETYGTYAAVEMTEAAGIPWIVQSDGRVYSGCTSNCGAQPTSGGSITWPAPTPQEQPPFRLEEKGKMECVGTTSDPFKCGNTRADWVGDHHQPADLSTACNYTGGKGIYDPIWGGTCWDCPVDDGRGPWLRSTTPVNEGTACWRSAKEITGKAVLVQAPTGSGCPSGSFWDGYSPSGCCGSCWKCPDGISRRTANHINSDAACASSIADNHQESSATLLKYVGCPTPDAATMKLTGQRTPGNPFLDVGAGGCFACPVVDESGKFLVTDRNGNSIADKTNNTGCTIQIKWKPAPFYEPGLAYMQGVKDVIWDKKLFDGTLITGYLYDLAEAKGLGDATPEAKEWVIARWQEIAKSPYNNETMRSLMFVVLKAALNKNAEARTDGEKKLIQSFAGYIQQRRTYLAKEALAMYDSWKANDDEWRASTGQSRQLGGLFYYGTVPYDFHGTLSGLMALGGVGVGTAGTLVSATALAKIHVGIRSVIYSLTSDLNILKNVAGLTALSGTTAVQVAGVILTSIAIDQFVKIETARPKLLAAVANAEKDVDLNSMLSAKPDEVYLFWSKAMDTTDNEDPQVIQVAAMAHANAYQTGYAAPPKNVPAVFRHTQQGAASGHTDTIAHYVTWDNSKWTVTLEKGIFTHTPANGSQSHTDSKIQYLSWDNTQWTATVLPDGKTFRHVNTAGQSHDSTMLAYKLWDGSNWTLSIETPSLP